MLLEKYKEGHCDGKEIVIIMDNAKYNRVCEVLRHAEKLNNSVKYLPPYCPNLNLIAKGLEISKGKTNKHIEKYEDFKV